MYDIEFYGAVKMGMKPMMSDEGLQECREIIKKHAGSAWHTFHVDSVARLIARLDNERAARLAAEAKLRELLTENGEDEN